MTGKQRFLTIDACGFVVAHFGADAPAFEGVHYASLLPLSAPCKAAIAELLGETDTARPRRAADRCLVRDHELETEVRLTEAIRIERARCDVRRLLQEAVLSVSSQPLSHAQVNFKLGRDVPELVHLDLEKILWATTSLLRSAVLLSGPASLLKRPGPVEIELSGDPLQKLVSVTIESEGPTEANPVDGALGQSSPAGKLVRSIIEAHGGILYWETVPGRKRMGTRVSFTLPTP